MTTKRVLLIGALVLSMGFCQQVTSYTSAKVENSANIRICAWEEALIAMPEVINVEVIKTITKTHILTDEGEEINESVSSGIVNDNFWITNNMNETIDIFIYFKRGFSKTHKGLSIAKKQNLVLHPGKTLEVELEVDDHIDSENIDVIVTAEWKNGYAEILSNIDVNVRTNIVNVQKDFRTPVKEIKNDENGEKKEELRQGSEVIAKTINKDNNATEVLAIKEMKDMTNEDNGGETKAIESKEDNENEDVID